MVEIPLSLDPNVGVEAGKEEPHDHHHRGEMHQDLEKVIGCDTEATEEVVAQVVGRAAVHHLASSWVVSGSSGVGHVGQATAGEDEEGQQEAHSVVAAANAMAHVLMLLYIYIYF